MVFEEPHPDPRISAICCVVASHCHITILPSSSAETILSVIPAKSVMPTL